MVRRWRRNQPITDDDFMDAWKPYIWKAARRLCRLQNLPEHHVEDYVSAGLAALACVKRRNRWSARYVMTAIRNRMLSAGRRRLGQPHPCAVMTLEAVRGLQSADPEDELIGAIDAGRALAALPAEERAAIRMKAVGCTEREIARELGIRGEEVRDLTEAARAQLRTALN